MKSFLWETLELDICLLAKAMNVSLLNALLLQKLVFSNKKKVELPLKLFSVLCSNCIIVRNRKVSVFAAMPIAKAVVLMVT